MSVSAAVDINSRYFVSTPPGLIACIPSLPSSLPRVSALIWLHASFAPVCISIKASCAGSEALPSLTSSHPIVHVHWQEASCWISVWSQLTNIHLERSYNFCLRPWRLAGTAAGAWAKESSVNLLPKLMWLRFSFFFFLSWRRLGDT